MSEKKNIVIALLTMLLFSAIFPCSSSASVRDIIEDDPMFALKEGWAWPVVVVPPPGGWDTPEGESAKYAMRIAEREVSRQRGAIRGKEVVFLFSSVEDPAELPDRLREWRGMDVLSVISLAGGRIDDELRSLCMESGPAVIFAAGEELGIIDPIAKRPYTHLFALDLHHFARANAIAEAIANEGAQKKTAVVSDLMSTRLARGADLNVAFLRSRGVETLDIAVPAFQQDRFGPQTTDLESGGVRVFSVWLDAMATLSIWRSANISAKGSSIYYCGDQHPILLDADGLTIVDKDSPLDRNESGKDDMVLLMRDEFARTPSDPVLAAKAFALAKWAIAAYSSVSSIDQQKISSALAVAKDLPLMDELISIDPNTHRPIMRKFGILRVRERTYDSHAVAEVRSAEVNEFMQ